MEITVKSLTTNQFTGGLSNVVEIVHWSATDGTSVIQGSTRLNPPKEIFKPLTELTEDQVVSWVVAKDAARIKKMLADTTAKMLVTSVSPPWAEDFAYEEPDDVRVIRQTYEYNQAVARLAQYVVAEGRAEVREMQPTGEKVFNEETGEMEDVMAEVVTVTAIAPVDATVEVTEYDENGENPVTKTIENPLITSDNAERAAAQAVIDNTPEEIKQ